MYCAIPDVASVVTTPLMTANNIPARLSLFIFSIPAIVKSKVM